MIFIIIAATIHQIRKYEADHKRGEWNEKKKKKELIGGVRLQIAAFAVRYGTIYVNNDFVLQL